MATDAAIGIAIDAAIRMATVDAPGRRASGRADADDVTAAGARTRRGAARSDAAAEHGAAAAGARAYVRLPGPVGRARRSTVGARIARRHVAPRCGGIEQAPEDGLQLGDRHANLLHRVALADRHLSVARLALVGIADGLDVDGHAIRRADLVLAPIEASDRGCVVVEREPASGEPPTQLMARGDDLPALLEQRKHRDLDGGQLGME